MLPIRAWKINSSAHICQCLRYRASENLDRFHFKLIFFLYNIYNHANHIWASAWDFQQCGICDQQSLRSACAYVQSDQSPCLSLEYFMIAKLLTEHHLEFLRLKGGCTGWSESRLIKMPHCWKSHALAHLLWCRENAYSLYISRSVYSKQKCVPVMSP